MTKLKRLGFSLIALMLGLLAMDVGERLSVPGVALTSRLLRRVWGVR